MDELNLLISVSGKKQKSDTNKRQKFKIISGAIS